MTTVQRVEWRGDLFASDLPRLMGRLGGATATPYELPYTFTIFLLHANAEFGLDRVLRIRSYSDLRDLSPDSVHGAILEGLRSKLQVKAASGATTELANGRVVPFYPGAERAGESSLELQLGDALYTPASVRVARRLHYELPSAFGAAPFRVTVDTERHLYRIAGAALRPLGAMGPRVEIKAADARDVAAALDGLNPDAMLRTLPFRSLELLFGDMLRDAVPASSTAGVPEIEAKFELTGCDAASATAAAVAWIRRSPRMNFVLPYPHRIVRMRRYHVCAGDDDAQHTVVETAAGRLSAKTKRDPAVRGAALVRTTLASRTTDVDGACEPVESFVARHNWRRLGTMIKTQAKIPFVLASGSAYLVSVDDCADADGAELRQVELEYIGHRGAALPADAICAELNVLAAALQREPLGAHLRATTVSKHEFFGRRAAG